MARPATYLTLIVATLLGPCFCCCTVNQLLAGSHSNHTAQAAGSLPQTTSSCPNCRSGNVIGVGQHSRPEDPAQPIPRCPCCDGKVDRVLANPVSNSPIAIAMPFVEVLTVATAPTCAIASTTTRWEYPPGIGQQTFLLDYCHRLRC